MPNSNLDLLRQVAKRLGPLLPEVVFVGGCTTGLFITDEAAAEVRPTFDVDVIAEIISYPASATFSERLRALGFREDTSSGAPLCRWLIEDMKLDLMPIEEKILGFTNRWYKAAMDAATDRELEAGLRIRVVTPPYFIATKLEAFRGRGKGDYASSHDLEDPRLARNSGLSGGSPRISPARSRKSGTSADPEGPNQAQLDRVLVQLDRGTGYRFLACGSSIELGFSDSPNGLNRFGPTDLTVGSEQG
jgi:hypothetical protein